jgi:predicted TIM-barrel fold metal-dependent hydrolase
MIATPWGDLAVADAHVHFFSHRFLSLLAGQKQCAVEELQPLLGWRFPPEDPVGLAAEWATELDRHGVDRAALIASLPGDWSSVQAAVAARPDRFHGYFMVNPLAPGAAEDVANILAGGGRGICLFPAMHGYPLHDARACEVVGVVARHPGAVLFVHCGVLSVGVRKKLGLPCLFDLRFSNPVDVHALAMAHPSLPFVIPHFGAGYLREALMVCSLCPNVHLDTSSTNSWMACQESRTTLEDVFERALAVAGPRRLLFGTDSSFFPRGWHRAVFDTQVAALAKLGVGSDDARAIFGGNLARLVGG